MKTLRAEIGPKRFHTVAARIGYAVRPNFGQ